MELTVERPVAIALLVGLWCEADDGGAFEWKPIMLKARYLAATGENAAELLDLLAAKRCVKRFEIGGRAIGVVRNFSRFQRPRRPLFLFPTTAESRSYAGADLAPAVLGEDAGEESSMSATETVQAGPFPTLSGIEPRMEVEEERREDPPPPPPASEAKNKIEEREPSNVEWPPACPPAATELGALFWKEMGNLGAGMKGDLNRMLAELLQSGVPRSQIEIGIRDMARAGFRPKFVDRVRPWALGAAAKGPEPPVARERRPGASTVPAEPREPETVRAPAAEPRSPPPRDWPGAAIVERLCAALEPARGFQKFQLAESIAPDQARRALIDERRKALAEALAPAKAEEAAAVIAELFRQVPGARCSPEERRAIEKSYVDAVRGEPAWAIDAARQATLDAGETFRPGAPKLLERARAARFPFDQEAARIDKLLAATVYRDREMDRRERAASAAS